ncbi:hypothetical protein BH09SUM1_BH09SUM1_07130 [soil metagenome]
MRAQEHPLEIIVHTVDGGVHRFFQDGQEHVTRILASLNPTRFYTQKQLVIAGSYFMAGFISTTITHIELASQSMPAVGQLGELKEAEQISEKEMDHRALPNFTDTKRADLEAREGALETYAEFSMVSGKRICARLVARAAARVDQRQLTQNIINGNGFHITRLGGGMIIMNPSNIAHWAFYPGLPEAPLNSWVAHRMDFKKEDPDMSSSVLHDEPAPAGPPKPGGVSLLFRKVDANDLNPGAGRSEPRPKGMGRKINDE